MSMLLDGKVALVIGGTDGIGKVVTYALAKEGASVALLTHNPELADELAEDLRKKSCKGKQR